MPIFMIIALDIVITLRFSINCSAVICSPTVLFSILREASSETYGPRVYFPSYKFPIYYFAIFYFPIYKPKIPKIFTLPLIYLYQISLLQVTVKGLTTPLSRWVQVWCLFVQVFGDLCVVSYWIDTLVLKTEGNTYSTLLHHPFLFKGKTDASSRGSRKNFWRRCQGDLHQAETYQVPIINSHPSHYIICHSPLVFLSPTSKTIFEKIRLFLRPSTSLLRPSSVRLLRLLFVCSCVGLL